MNSNSNINASQQRQEGQRFSVNNQNQNDEPQYQMPNLRNHDHSGQICEACLEIKKAYQNSLFLERSLRDDLFAIKSIMDKIKREREQQMINDQQIKKVSEQFQREYLSDYKNEFFKCFLACSIGYMSFGYGHHFKRFSLYPRYLSFIASFFMIIASLFMQNTNKRVLCLLLFLMIMSIMMSSILMLSKIIYADENMIYSLDGYIKKNLKLVGDERDTFTDYLQGYPSTKMYKFWMEGKAKSQFSLLKLGEIILFNAAILFGVFVISGYPIDKITLATLILFQVFFSHNIIYHVAQQIKFLKQRQLEQSEALKNNYEQDFGELEEKWNKNTINFSNRNSIQINQDHLKSKLGLAKAFKIINFNTYYQLLLSFVWQKQSKIIAGSSSTLFIISALLLGFTATVDNLSGNYLKFKEDSVFITVYFVYMMFLLVNISSTLIQKCNINDCYVCIRKRIEKSANYLEDFVEEITDAQEDQNYQNFNERQVIEATREYAETKQFARLTKNSIKENCERLLYVYRVTHGLLLKLSGLFGVFVLAALVH